MMPRPALTLRRSANDAITALLEARTGQQLDPGRNWRIDSALQPLLHDGGFASLDDLVARVVEGNERELADAVVDALLNHETSFFRDGPVLDHVARAAADMIQANPARRLRLWSAACSSGQEPLSLAMLFGESPEHFGAMLPEIRASDVSAPVLRRARAGRYTHFEVQRGLPIRRLMQWFDPVEDQWQAKAELRYRILYSQQNLIADLPPAGRFDIILCRNVLMYLAPPMRRRVLDRLACVLRPDGLLVLGAGETVIGHSDALVPSETYRGFYRPARR
ncbi:protein-glutamate O-methyltransferase CheR [Sphingomonas sp. VNH70]|uniref:CheR family methyltransferase n=1 Tax=Sphingomonas silueang TaxID=3156617 RepID=UPI0032B62836